MGCLYLLISLVVASNLPGYLEAHFDRTPPRLTEEPPKEVWYSLPAYEDPTKFTLLCEAGGEPDEFWWKKNGHPLRVDNKRIQWQRAGQSGTITFQEPMREDEGYYQCFVRNIFGTAVSKIVHVKMGVLEHFHRHEVEIKTVTVDQLDKLTLTCEPPYGVPQPTVFWLYRNEKQTHVIETIDRDHVTTDGDGNLQFSYVDRHDGRENLLYQCAASSPVLHGEYRAGPQTRLIVTNKTVINYDHREIMWTSPKEMRLVAGERLKMTCIFSGYPHVAPHWRRLDDVLPKSRLVTDVDHGKSLIIDPVHPSDAGVYECRLGKLKHRTTVTVVAAPFWKTGPPQDINRPELSTAELRCDADGDPPPLMRWYINGKPLISALEENGAMILEEDKVLRIPQLDHDKHTAVYQCNASNDLGYVFANAFVNVQAFAPFFEMPVNQTLRVIRDRTIDIDCKVKAAPLPVVKLVDQHDRIIKDFPDKLRIFPNKTIRIQGVQMDDAGLYYCNVSNKYGLNRAITKLEVYDPSHWEEVPKPRRKVLEAFDSMTLNCRLNVDPRLTVTYEWLKDGQIVNNSDVYNIPFPKRLEMRNLRGRHTGKYECVAKTIVEERRKGMRLIVTDLPDPPEITNITCDVQNKRTAIIEWARANPNNDEITEYILQYTMGFYPNKWMETGIITDPRAFPKHQEVYKAEFNLSAWVNYTFRVIAVNSHGESTPGYLESPCNTWPSHPYVNPTNVTAAGNEPDNLVIFWKPMPKELWNGEQFHYFIRYRLNDDHTEWSEFEVEDPLQDQVVIRNQPTFKQYQIQVGAKNIIGKALEEPKIKLGYSGENVPSYAPSDFKLTQVINATTVEFTWRHVTTESVNGHFKGYKVEVWPVTRESASKALGQARPVDAMVSPVEETVLVSGLRPMQTYHSHVRAVNKGYEGPPSNIETVRMPEGAPTEITKLFVKPLGAMTIYVTWGPPADPLGIMRGYFLVFENLNTGKREETFVDYRYEEYIFETAEPDTPYEVAVWAETGGGQGPNVTEAVKTWPLIKPGQPDIAVDVLGARTVRVTWLPSEQSLPGVGFYVNYSVVGTGHWQSREVMKSPKHTILINDLLPEKEYWIQTVSVDMTEGRPDRKMPSSLQKFRTETTGKRQAPNDYMTSAAWFIAVLCAVAVALISLIVVCIRQNRGGRYPVKKKEIEHGVGAVGYNDVEDEERNFMEYHFGPGYTKENT